MKRISVIRKTMVILSFIIVGIIIMGQTWRAESEEDMNKLKKTKQCENYDLSGADM